MKFKIGDKVRVKSFESLKKLDKSNIYGGLVSSMYEKAGDVCTIRKVDTCASAYYIKDNPYVWDERLFEDLEESTEDFDAELKEKYKEIFRLKELLENSEIPFTFESFENVGFHLCYPNNEEHKRVVSVIEHKYSYGSEADLLEIKGLLTKEEQDEDDVVGNMTAEEVFNRIQDHYIEAVEKELLEH